MHSNTCNTEKKSLHGASRVLHTFRKSFAHKPYKLLYMYILNDMSSSMHSTWKWQKKLILGEKSTSKFYIAIHKNKSPCFIQKIRLKVSFLKLYQVLEKNNKIWWHKRFHNGLKCHVATYCHKKCHGCQRPWTIELISSVLQLSL